MKKVALKLFTVLFFLIAVIPTAGILFSGPSEPGFHENLAPAPKLINPDHHWNTSLLSDSANWINDRFFLRQQMISAENAVNTAVFGSTGSSGVISGKKGWLYYRSTLEDFTGSNSLSDREIYCIAKNIALMQEYCEKNGRTFGFTVVPNKNSLYRQFMPHPELASPLRNVDRLTDILRQMNVNYLDLFTPFQQQDQILYFAHDSHWNSQGAALAADILNQGLGRTSSYFAQAFPSAEPHQGDLFSMLYPAFKDNETNPVFGGSLDFHFTGKSTNPNSALLETSGKGNDSLLCYRDSFGILLFPYLADSFETSQFSRSTAYDLTKPSDYVIIELVERNLHSLLESFPIFPAPVREIPVVNPCGEISLLCEISEDMQQVQGTLPLTPDVHSPVYLASDKGIFEVCLGADNSFEGRLPQEAAVHSVIFTIDGQQQALYAN